MTRAIFVTLLSVLFALPAAAQTAAPAPERTVPVTRQQVTLSFAPVVKKAIPAVVNIYTRKVIQNPTPMFADPLFRQFFGDAFGAIPRERVQNSLGSGVIVRSSGVVITNNHVAGDADQITVVLSDRREFEAKLVGKDERSDLAVLQLQDLHEALPALDLVDSDDVEVGDLVLAIGNPFGVGQTVTSGIVSALARTSIGVADFRSFIQTDAAVNPGNSGGALITSDGRLIGINTAIYSGNGGNIGIGFAIPSNMARTVLTGILKEGKVVRAWVGASGKTITAELAKSLSLARPGGVIIDRVTSGSPAASAGISVGDVVRSVNGHEVQDAEELRYMIASLPVGGKANIGVLHDGHDRTAAMPLQAPPDLPARKTTQMTGREPFNGTTIVNYNPAVADELGKDYQGPGVMVIDVRPGSIAANLGVRPGDLVSSINGKTATSVDDVVRLTAQPAPQWDLVIGRNGQSLQFSVQG
jgi:serine protease Do